ncbi:hypothetical protein G6F32_015492 [Rhizopus arrhizus]|nr:hypothetical protein G6F32_015492 [Rhizopus arrhizus]
MRAASSSSRGPVLKVWRSRKMPTADAKYGRPIANTLQQHQHEDEVAAAELEARECVAGQCRQHQLRGQHHRHQQEGVQEVARKRRGLPGPREVIQRQRGEQFEAGGVGRRVERRPHGVSQRQDPQEAQRPRAQGIELVFH